MDIEIVHKCKPEIEGDASLIVRAGTTRITLNKEGQTITLSHDEFIEMMNVHNAYNAARMSAEARVKTNV